MCLSHFMYRSTAELLTCINGETDCHRAKISSSSYSQTALDHLVQMADRKWKCKSTLHCGTSGPDIWLEKSIYFQPHRTPGLAFLVRNPLFVPQVSIFSMAAFAGYRSDRHEDCAVFCAIFQIFRKVRSLVGAHNRTLILSHFFEIAPVS